ncbi:tRNA (N6-threonylcarbamoyladenosine(37)-N6)-methyltransferase TrmO, partial [Geobacillus thermodenitrificans]|nr:tRNA (N6-threonylcarbamoyladenosine(37)-N6)-methyltransferase TrmO [Geobacillus thermodenitrificans]
MQYTITPIAFVRNNRKDVEDDYWGNVISIIELVDEIDDSALQGISEFSHLDIIFYFDRVTDGYRQEF